MRKEYDFSKSAKNPYVKTLNKPDTRKAKPNRFASRYQAGSRVIVLDADIAKVFTSAESVNAALRALLKAMPRGKQSTTR